MRRPIALPAVLLAAFVGALLPVTGALAAQDAGEGLRLTTFNIRYGTAGDGPNAWANRRALVADIIRRSAPDVLAIQEGLAFQLDQLGDVLADYRKLGQHRDGGLEGEFSGLYVNELRVRVRDWGEFWLSPTPDSVGSRGWDAALARMAVWVEIESVDGGEPIRVYGTHFDHRGEVARLESARLIARHAEDGPPAVVMGDLNLQEESEPLGVFFDRGYRSAFRVAHPQSELGTFNGFRDASGGRRLDHILLDPRLEPLAAEIFDEQVNGVWPSDHFAVSALVVHSIGAAANQSIGSAAEAEVLAMDQKIADAVVAGDVAYVDSVLSPDFVMVHGDQWTVGGEPLLIDDKQSFLRRVANKYYAVIQFDSVRAEMHGDVAITYGRYFASLRANAGTDRAWFYVWYERVFAERDGRWMFLSHRTVHGPIFGPTRESLSER
jgi:endonuclease/exonuclease/phosphatase family metal-dependent hydrolase/ketosteroid isomerase-like protein